MREYFVIDGEGFISTSVSIADEAEPEAFPKLASARKRARELARSEPGRTVVIAQSVVYVTCDLPLPAGLVLRERRLGR